MKNPYIKPKKKKQEEDDVWFGRPEPVEDDENTLAEVSASAIYDMVIQKGTTLDYDITYKDDEGNPVDLTGYKAKCMAQYHDRIFSIEATITDPTNGLIHLYLAPYDSSEIFTEDYRYHKQTVYHYQLDVLSAGKIVYRILVGKIFVEPMSGVL